MELKDIVLSTLAEIDNDIPQNDNEPSLEKTTADDSNPPITSHLHIKEEQFLKNLRERILVLFEGFKSPNTQNIEAKLDMTLNFLEYLLASIDETLKSIESKE